MVLSNQKPAIIPRDLFPPITAQSAGSGLADVREIMIMPAGGTEVFYFIMTDTTPSK